MKKKSNAHELKLKDLKDAHIVLKVPCERCKGTGMRTMGSYSYPCDAWQNKTVPLVDLVRVLVKEFSK